MTEAFSVVHWPPWWAIIRRDDEDYLIVAEFGEDWPGDPEAVARETCARLNEANNAALVALAKVQD